LSTWGGNTSLADTEPSFSARLGQARISPSRGGVGRGTPAWPTRSQAFPKAAFCVARLTSPLPSGERPAWPTRGQAFGDSDSLVDTQAWATGSRQRRTESGPGAPAGATGARQRTTEYWKGLPQLHLFFLRAPLTGSILGFRHPYFFTPRRCSASLPVCGVATPVGLEHARHGRGGGRGGGHRHTVRRCVAQWSGRLTTDQQFPGPDPTCGAGHRHRRGSKPCGQSTMDF
jgi:hypothetical protein